MPLVHFISFDGTRRSIETSIGQNLMRAATDNAVPGIDGDCGGQCACATCHVYVPAPWGASLPAKMRCGRHGRSWDMRSVTS